MLVGVILQNQATGQSFADKLLPAQGNILLALSMQGNTYPHHRQNLTYWQYNDTCARIRAVRGRMYEPGRTLTGDSASGKSGAQG
ncbi:hypothetical protein DYGSA30_46930 [Dyella sp. GSA-30]|nr:hypothetical protein DYGSA30_46930 [Dyella sp. GSA-30]